MLLLFLPCTKTSTCIDSPYYSTDDNTHWFQTAMALEPGLSESVIQSVSRP